MRFLSFLASAALAALALAQSDSQLGFTSVPTSVDTGTSYKIEWSGGANDSPVTIALRKGDVADIASIRTIQILTTDATGNSFNWIPNKSLVDGNDYNLQITQGLNSINFSGQISVSGGIDPVSASISSILASASSAIASANATISQLAPITSLAGATSSGASASGTGTAISRNSTFSSATLPATTTSTAVETSTAAASSASATSTGGADAMTSRYASPMALFCAILAAIAYAI